MIVVTATGICIGNKASVSRVNNCSLKYIRRALPSHSDTKHKHFSTQGHAMLLLLCFSLLHKVSHCSHVLLHFCSLSPMLTCANMHIVPARAHVFRHTFPPIRLHFHLEMLISSRVISNYCSWTHLTTSPCLEKMFSKAQRRSWKQIKHGHRSL